jgi:hypothetical protein
MDSANMSPEMFYAERKEAGLLIDPETADYYFCYGSIMDPYGVYPRFAEDCAGRIWFAHTPETGAVSFYDLPEQTRTRLRERVETEPREDLFPLRVKGEYSKIAKLIASTYLTSARPHLGRRKSRGKI